MFQLSTRDASGVAVLVSPAEFSIAFMLPMSAPPLPHTIAIEVANLNGQVSFDSVFKRHAPLPAQTKKTYRADRTLRPSDADQTLPIKFREIDVSEDPREKWWAGCVHIRAEELRRPLMEGSEIELLIKIDKSRKMTVEVSIPSTAREFSDEVFVPDPPTTRDQLQKHLDLFFDRVNRVYKLIYAAGRDDPVDQADAIQFKLEAEERRETRLPGETTAADEKMDRRSEVPFLKE